jgi:ABC-type hemin transport system ATPase subunit
MNDSQSGSFCFLNESVTLSFRNVLLKRTLAILSQRTQIKISYSTNHIDTMKKIPFQVENTTVAGFP